ncbi:uncharacterized protein LY79DRAFT_319668 [Colletotrichum navitas]|uniref:Uncharacterized protein n=1 Tax=Colletotrichum navitas TaxID=681940 RepID=A0AAD8VAE4_9PEZI|nr:uncharacterized protein LY79DRAFT_319668 [Colletotrichum navitas]KAK1597846.1 hypothetical protein LY79DRAFT_319668 [Colletotrichum navitas]
MQPIAYLGPLMLLTAQAQTAPSSLHSHLQRHRDRVATHAHSSHQHSQLIEQIGAAPMKLSQDMKPALHHMVMERSSAPSPYDRSALASTEYREGRPKTANTEAKASSRRETDAMTALVQSGPGPFNLAAARGGSGFNPDADSANSLHLDAAMRLLRAHAIVKHHKFQREV